jgi:hypothetical protein
MPRGWRAPCAAALAALAVVCAPAAATAATATKTLTVKITSGPVGTVGTPNVSFSFLAEGTTQPGTVFHCGETPLSLKECSSPHTLGPLAPGPHTFYVEATNRSANAYSALTSCRFTVAASADPATGGSGCAAGTQAAAAAPLVSSLVQSAARWREGSGLARISRAAKPPTGTTFSFTLSEAAVALVSFKQVLSGRSVGGRCVAQTQRNRTKRACRHTKLAGTLVLAAHAGSDRVRFEGRLSAARKLKPGRYTMVLSASAESLTSAPRALSFTIVG